MDQRDLSLFSVTPAASLLSRCVSVGAVSQNEIDSAFSDQSPVFSSHVQEAEEQITKQKQLDELQLQLELLRVDQQSADVTHAFHLAQKNKRLQTLGDHLQDVLREQKILRQRLMRPLARTDLPVLAHYHGFVVNSIKLMIDFIECLEEKLRSARSQSSTTDSLALLETSRSLILTVAAEEEALCSKILQWRSEQQPEGVAPFTHPK